MRLFSLLFTLFLTLAPILPIFLPSAFADTSPRRIISLAPSLTETLFALNAGDRVIAVTKFCDYPPEVKKLPTVGGLVDRSYEAIFALKPDLIVATKEGEDIRRKLQVTGAQVLFVKQETVEDILIGIEILAKTVGEEEKGREIVTSAKEEMNLISTKLKGRTKPKVLLSAASERSTAKLVNIIIAGPKTYLGELLELAGGQNVYQGSIPYPTISAEAIVALNPEVVIELLPETLSEDKSLSVPVSPEQIKSAWQELSVFKVNNQTKVHVLAAEYTVNPGPRFINTLKDIAQIIHPDTMPK